MADLRSIMNLEEDQLDASDNKRETGPASPVPRSFRESHPSLASSQHQQHQAPSSLPLPHHPTVPSSPGSDTFAALQHPSLPSSTLQEAQRTQYHHPHPQDQPVQMDPNFWPYDPRAAAAFAQYPASMPADHFSSAPSSSQSLTSPNHQAFAGAFYRGSNTPEHYPPAQPVFVPGQPDLSHGHYVAPPPPPDLTPPATGTLISPRPPVDPGLSGSQSDGYPSVKYTTVTGRVSKALKGVPVHTCYDCVPARVRGYLACLTAPKAVRR
jgi:hypothetical protein